VQAARSREPVERFKHERGEGSLFGACQIFELVPGFFPNPDHDADLALAAGGTGDLARTIVGGCLRRRRHVGRQAGVEIGEAALFIGHLPAC
jgi:hypothetical protein